MKWIGPTPPNDEDKSYYDHVMCKTPLGVYIIEWKGWKERDSYSITLRGVDGIGESYLNDGYDLDEAKDLCHEHLVETYNKLKTFLKL